MIELRRLRLGAVAGARGRDERVAGAGPAPEHHFVGAERVAHVAEVPTQHLGLPALLGLLTRDFDAAPQIGRHCLVGARRVRALAAEHALRARRAAAPLRVFLRALDLPGREQRDGGEDHTAAEHVGERDRSADRVVNGGQGDERAGGDRNGGADVLGPRHDTDPEGQRDDRGRAGAADAAASHVTGREGGSEVLWNRLPGRRIEPLADEQPRVGHRDDRRRGGCAGRPRGRLRSPGQRKHAGKSEDPRGNRGQIDPDPRFAHENEFWREATGSTRD